jgi:predicted DNA-binding helix-hairpin-helix protein
MNTTEKLEILSADSQYDLACACGTGDQDRRRRGLDGRWLYPVPLAAGGHGIMFKTLLSNCCSSDCLYCPLRGGGNARRCTLSPEEAAKAFYEHHERRRLLGLFLSSGVINTPDQTMDRLLASAEILRRRYRYRGYIHLKIIPGASEAAIEAALRTASAVSLNIEVPGRRHFEKLSRYKNFDRDIVAPLKFIAAHTARGAKYARVKCTTQFIVGASDENDREIIQYMDGIYNRLKFERVYFSAYQPGLGDRSLPGEQFNLDPGDRLSREHRLYQVDFLLRKYRFDPGEIPFAADGRLDLNCDPKQVWASRHPEFFPVRLHTADREALLRVPGLGPVFVDRVIAARRQRHLPHLAMAGIRGKLAERATPYLDFS